MNLISRIVVLVVLLNACIAAATLRVMAQVPVPAPCIQLAQREGYPTDIMTRTQVARAKVRMARLSSTDPVVRQCRDAISQLQAMGKEQP